MFGCKCSAHALVKPRFSPFCDLLFFFRENGRSPLILEFIHLQRNSLYRAVRIADFEGILDFSVLLIIIVKAGLMQITTCSPSLAEDDSRLTAQE